jgi:hypothetical protein
MDLNTPPYKYAGIPLTPNVIADLAKVLMTAPMFRRAQLVTVVQEYHAAHGGASSQASVTQATKKALSTLANAGLLESTGAYGIWRWICPPETPAERLIMDVDDDETDELYVSAETIIEGEGSGSVYVYYFPNYKELADLRQEESWQVKVGMTSLSDAKFRITEQQGTVMPEQPVIAYVRRTDKPLRLERLIHSVLFFRGRQLEDSPGSEWFKSSPTEVKSIIDWAHGF